MLMHLLNSVSNVVNKTFGLQQYTKLHFKVLSMSAQFTAMNLTGRLSSSSRDH